MIYMHPHKILPMKKRISLLSVLLLFLVITGCTSLKRFRSVTYSTGGPSPVKVELFSTHLEPGGAEQVPRNLWNLSASAQTQLIQILNERYPDNGQFIQSLSNEYLADPGTGAPDFTRQDLKMVFSVTRKRDYHRLNDPHSRFSPADRIEYLSINLKIPDNVPVRFTGWNRYVTEYGEIEIGDVNFSRSLDLSVDAEPMEGVGIGAKTGRSRTEKQVIRSRYLQLNGSITDRNMRIEEEGTRETDLTGNVIADVSLEFKGFPEKVAKPVFGGELEDLQFIDVLVPRWEDPPDTLFALLEASYIYRHVKSGWKTYPEYDDRVELYSGNFSKEVPLFTRNAYVPPFFGIGEENPVGSGNNRIITKDFVKVVTGTGYTYQLQFLDSHQARQVLDWLRLKAQSGSEAELTIGGHRLQYKGEPLTGERLSELSLRLVKIF